MQYMILLYTDNEYTVFRFKTRDEAQLKLRELSNTRGIDSAELLEYTMVDGWER